MRAFRTVWHIAAVVAVVFHLAGSIVAAAEKNGRMSRGRELFLREWQKHDLESPDGDGLGPMFNARSCVACHNQAGVGGGGANDHNVDIVSVDVSAVNDAERRVLADRLSFVHPGLVNNAATTVLHRFSTDPLYAQWRDGLAPLQKAGDGPPVRILTPTPNVMLQVSQRSTPALFGAAAIDALPNGFLHAVAARQAKLQPRTAGRVAGGGRPRQPEGKFGWRGQIATLNDFVRGACAAEVGLQLPNHAQSANPRLNDKPMEGFDMSENDATHLVRFVSSLPQPQQEMPRDPLHHSLVRRGEMLFNSIGCAACHTRMLGPIQGIYSDLLLHDMGENLADLGAEGANPSSGNLAGYYGSSTSILVHKPDPKKQREWRTPPLWGVRDSAPYLHDGRAATLREAIVMHGGQGEPAAKNFAVLSSDQQSRLLLFLNTLVAPQESGPGGRDVIR